MEFITTVLFVSAFICFCEKLLDYWQQLHEKVTFTKVACLLLFGLLALFTGFLLVLKLDS